MLLDSMTEIFPEKLDSMIEIFSEIYDKEIEYILNPYRGKPNSSKYSFDNFFLEKFLDKEPKICKEIIPKINEIINNNPINDEKIVKDVKLLVKNFDTSLRDDMDINPLDIEFTKENLFAYKIAEFLYEEYTISINRRFFVPENNRLIKLYDKKNIDLKKSPQYSKYGLINIDDNFEIRTSNAINGNKVYDKRLKTHLFINEISHKFLYLLKELKNEGIITSLSLRPEYNYVGEGLLDISVFQEEIERGHKFSFQDLSNPVVSKLYSKNNSKDNLWINIDIKNITFEELLDDFQIEGNYIVTQVVHLEYVDNLENFFITHIDHEYIFYTEDEYDNRLTNYKQKGKGKKRYKTFKVDNSKIPFTLKNGDFFLYRVLDKYFKKKELLHEYFEDVLNK